jgi:N-acyl-D-amino-acid deacylase
LSGDKAGQMRQELAAALAAGCFGMSSGLVYPPGCFAPDEELIDLARVCAAQGALYTTHMRCEGDRLEAAIEETLRVARESGARTQISHLKTSQPRNWHKIAFLEETLFAARKGGMDIHADRYPYAASATGLDAVLPRWAYAGGTSEELRRLEDPAACARLEAEITALNPGPEYWSRVLIAAAVDPRLNTRVAGRTIAAVAEEWAVRPFECLRRILVEDLARTQAIFFSMSEENLARILSWDFVMIGSDATARNTVGPTRVTHPHPRTFGTFPRVLARYVRQDKLLSLEEAVRKMTSLPADTFHLAGRGRIAEGGFADLVLFDLALIQDEATFTEPNRFPRGIRAVYVNGTQVVDGGNILDARPGKVLRRGRT